jgi:hypothetical protein
VAVTAADELPPFVDPITTIIGHGLSPVGKGWGSRIDETIVVRMKDASWQSAEDYGTRVDYMASSTEILPVMLNDTGLELFWQNPEQVKIVKWERLFINTGRRFDDEPGARKLIAKKLRKIADDLEIWRGKE